MNVKKLVNEIKIPPLILISIIKINHSFKKPKENISIYKNLNLNNITKNFIKKFEFSKDGSKIIYKDVEIWESQFENGNIFAILKDISKSSLYLMHISFLTEFHKDLIKYELDTFEEPNILNHVENFVEIEKDILKRNSSREMFQFCCEFHLSCPNYIEDKKAKRMKDMVNPFLVTFYHYEFLNDFKVYKDKVYFIENCSVFKTKHLKIYTLKNYHLLKFKKESSKSNTIDFYKNLSSENLNRIFGKTVQNYENLKKKEPDNKIVNSEKVKVKKIVKRVILTTEQLYM